MKEGKISHFLNFSFWFSNHKHFLKFTTITLTPTCSFFSPYNPGAAWKKKSWAKVLTSHPSQFWIPSSSSGVGMKEALISPVNEKLRASEFNKPWQMSKTEYMLLETITELLRFSWLWGFSSSHYGVESCLIFHH